MKNRLFAFILSFLLVGSVTLGSAVLVSNFTYNQSRGGDSSVSKLDSSATEINDFGEISYDDGSYKLSNEAAKNPIFVVKTNYDADLVFSGTFDGNGATFIVIVGSDDYPYAGLFDVCVGATIKNVVVYYASITGTYFAGGICGLAINTRFINCTVCGDPYDTVLSVEYDEEGNPEYDNGWKSFYETYCDEWGLSDYGVNDEEYDVTITAGVGAGGICGAMIVTWNDEVNDYSHYGAFYACHSSALVCSTSGDSFVGGIVGILDTLSLCQYGEDQFAIIDSCYYNRLNGLNVDWFNGYYYYQWLENIYQSGGGENWVEQIIWESYNEIFNDELELTETELLYMISSISYDVTEEEVNLVAFAIGSNWKVTASCVFDKGIFWMGATSGYYGSGLITIAFIDLWSLYYYQGFLEEDFEFGVGFTYCYSTQGTSHMVTVYDVGELGILYYDDYLYSYYYQLHINDYEDNETEWAVNGFSYWYSGEIENIVTIYNDGWMFQVIDGAVSSWGYPLPNYSFSVIVINGKMDYSTYDITYPHADIPGFYLATEPIYILETTNYQAAKPTYEIEVDASLVLSTDYDEEGNEILNCGGWEIYEAYDEYDEACWTIESNTGVFLGKWAYRNILFTAIEYDYYTYTLTVNYSYYSGTDTITLTVYGYDDETGGTYERKSVSYGSSVTVTCHTEDSPHFSIYSSTTAYLQIGSVPTETSYKGIGGFSYYSSGSINVYVVQGYSVSYNDNVTSTYISVPSTQYRIYGGSAITLSSTVPTRNGYIFSSWNTASGGSGTKYSPGGSYSANASVTLYAQWTLVSYTLTYNLSGGTYNSSTSNYSVTYTIETSGTLITPTYSGHTFNGWYLSTATGAWSAGTYSAGASYSSKYGDVTLVAQWTSTGYTLTYNLNGGTYNSSTSNYTYSYGSDLTFTLITPTYTGYTFSCWEVTTADGNWTSGDTYTTETSISGMYGNTTLTAVWTANNAAKYNTTGKYWYVEYGYMPQTKVTSSSTISSLNSSASTTGKSYTMAGVSLVEYVYNSAYYVKFNSNWYQVEAVKWRLTYSSSQASGYVATSATMATLASIVFIDQYSTSSIGSGSGYSSNSMSHFTTAIKSWSSTIGTSYLSTFSGYIDKFSTSGITSTSTTSGSMLVSSLDEIEDVNGSYAIGFSDLVGDMLTYLGYINSYFTRNLGSNLNNIKCGTEGGAVTQRLATNYNGVCFTVKFSEYTCVS